VKKPGTQTKVSKQKIPSERSQTKDANQYLKKPS
jgi:hypothetical protein